MSYTKQNLYDLKFDIYDKKYPSLNSLISYNGTQVTLQDGSKVWRTEYVCKQIKSTQEQQESANIGQYRYGIDTKIVSKNLDSNFKIYKKNSDNTLTEFTRVSVLPLQDNKYYIDNVFDSGLILLNVKYSGETFIVENQRVYGSVIDSDFLNKIQDELIRLESSKHNITDVINNLTSDDIDKSLSAKQGKVLKGFVDNINNLLKSDDVSLDTIQEFVDFVKKNKTDITNLTSVLNNKVDKVSGKVLSTNDYTNTDKNKLSNIENRAQVNVMSNWTETDSSSKSYILNKPVITASDVKKENLENIRIDNDTSSSTPNPYKILKPYHKYTLDVTTSGTAEKTLHINNGTLDGQWIEIYFNEWSVDTNWLFDSSTRFNLSTGFTFTRKDFQYKRLKLVWSVSDNSWLKQEIDYSKPLISVFLFSRW